MNKTILIILLALTNELVMALEKSEHEEILEDEIERIAEDLDYFYDYEALVLMKQMEDKANSSEDLAEMFFKAFDSEDYYGDEDYDYTEEDIDMLDAIILIDFEEESSGDDGPGFLAIDDVSSLVTLETVPRINWSLIISVIVIFVVGVIICILSILIIIKRSSKKEETQDESPPQEQV